MDPKHLAYFERRLIREKERLEAALAQNGRFGLDDSQTDAIQELSAYDNHPADLGSELFEREKDLALWNNSQEALHRIGEALGFIAEGKYGICEVCNREIPLERLKAVPQTTFCMDCRMHEEERHQNRERPIEEEVLWPPFGRTFLDGKDVVGFDGEDTWQAVAQWGTSESPSDLGGVDSYEDMYKDSDHETHEIVELTGETPPYDLREI